MYNSQENTAILKGATKDAATSRRRWHKRKITRTTNQKSLGKLGSNSQEKQKMLGKFSMKLQTKETQTRENPNRSTKKVQHENLLETSGRTAGNSSATLALYIDTDEIRCSCATTSQENEKQNQKQN